MCQFNYNISVFTLSKNITYTTVINKSIKSIFKIKI